MLHERIAILSAPGDIGWREAAVQAMPDFAHTKVALTARSVLDPGYPVLLIWTALASMHAELARALLTDRRDVIVWRPDGACAPPWLSNAYPLGPEMPARSLAIVARFALAEHAGVPAAPRTASRRVAPAACAVGAALLGCAVLAAQWKPATVETAPGPPLAELRGRQ